MKVITDQPDRYQELHKINGIYYLVSKVVAFDHKKWETIIFESNSYGEVYSWKSLYEYRGEESISRSLEKFKEQLNGNGRIR